MALSPKQRRFFNTKLPRMTIVEGCISSGKTFTCNHKAVKQILEMRHLPGLIMFVGRTLATLEKNVLRPLSEMYRGIFEYSITQKKAKLGNILIDLEGCNDASAEVKIRGTTAKLIYGDELTIWNRDFLVRCMGSLRVPGAVFLGTTNPGTPTNFVMTDYLRKKDKLGILNIQFTMDDNPSLTEEYKRQVNMEYTGVYHDRFIKGLWVHAEGRVYGIFDEKIHVVPTVPRNYTKYYLSCDYGTQNPFALGLWGLCDGVWYKVKEYHYSGRDSLRQKTDGEYAKAQNEFISDLKYKPPVVIDPSAASYALELGKHGYVTIPANNNVADGIRVTGNLLNQGRIKINDCCKHTIEEFSLYIWDRKAIEERPVKENDHHMDETRYFCYTILSAYTDWSAQVGRAS